jgi:hypothetical protein
VAEASQSNGDVKLEWSRVARCCGCLCNQPEDNRHSRRCSRAQIARAGQGLGVRAGSKAEAEAAGLRAGVGCTGKLLLPVFDLYEPFPGIPAERRPLRAGAADALTHWAGRQADVSISIHLSIYRYHACMHPCVHSVHMCRHWRLSAGLHSGTQAGWQPPNRHGAGRQGPAAAQAHGAMCSGAARRGVQQARSRSRRRSYSYCATCGASSGDRTSTSSNLPHQHAHAVRCAGARE